MPPLVYLDRENIDNINNRITRADFVPTRIEIFQKSTDNIPINGNLKNILPKEGKIQLNIPNI